MMLFVAKQMLTLNSLGWTTSLYRLTACPIGVLGPFGLNACKSPEEGTLNASVMGTWAQEHCPKRVPEYPFGLAHLLGSKKFSVGHT